MGSATASSWCAQVAAAVGRAFEATGGDPVRAQRLVVGDGVALLADVGIRAERPEEVAA